MGSVAALLFAWAVPSRADNGMPTVLPNCINKAPEARPAEVVFACGDGNLYASKLKWTNWGSSQASATGVLEQNDCTPYCAAGHFHSYKVNLTASGKQRCPNGALAYATVSYTVLDKSYPYPDRKNSQNFPCRQTP